MLPLQPAQGETVALMAPTEVAFQQRVMATMEPLVQSTTVAFRTVAQDHANNAIATAKERSVAQLKGYSDQYCEPRLRDVSHASVEASATVVAGAAQVIVRQQLDRAEQQTKQAATKVINDAAAAAYPYVK